MRFVLIGVGSMGDVMPHVTLAARLAARGHRAVVIGLASYARLAAARGVEYVPIPGDTSVLWPDGAVRRRLALAQPGIMYATMLRRFSLSASMVNDVLVSVVRPGDVVVTGIVSAGAARLLGSEVRATTLPVLFAPLLPATSPASSALAPAFGGRALAFAGSSVMWRLSERLAAAHTADMAKRLDTRTVPPLGRGPVLMATSPTLTPPSPCWPEQVHQTGWITPSLSTEPDALGRELSDFLASGPPPVLMTFGTCPAVSPARDVDMFLQAAHAMGRRVVLQSDALDRGAVNDWAFNAPGVPHSSLMPRVSVVVHHGGAGTTHAALASGRPAMVVPHLGDQGYYARRVHDLGAGPRAVPRWRLTASLLTRRLRTLTVGESAQRFSRAASRVATTLREEDGPSAAVAALDTYSGA